MSSANMRILFFIESGKSLTYSRKRSGPITEPCGTPLMTKTQPEKLFWIPTLVCLDSMKFLIQVNSCESVPKAVSLYSNLACGTVSNAFL